MTQNWYVSLSSFQKLDLLIIVYSTRGSIQKMRFVVITVLIVLVRIIESPSSPLLIECIHNILDRNSYSRKQNILINFDLFLKYPVIKIKETTEVEKRIFVSTRFSTIIIDARILNLTDFILWDFKRELFNPKVNYVILTELISSKIFKLFAKLYIASVLIIDKNFSLFSYNPYIYESADDPDVTPIKIGDCPDIPEDVMKLTTHVPKYWRNTTLKVCSRVMEPYTTEKDDGLENKLLRLIQQRLKIIRRKSFSIPPFLLVMFY